VLQKIAPDMKIVLSAGGLRKGGHAPCNARGGGGTNGGTNGHTPASYAHGGTHTAHGHAHTIRNARAPHGHAYVPHNTHTTHNTRGHTHTARNTPDGRARVGL